MQKEQTSTQRNVLEYLDIVRKLCAFLYSNEKPLSTFDNSFSHYYKYAFNSFSKNGWADRSFVNAS